MHHFLFIDIKYTKFFIIRNLSYIIGSEHVVIHPLEFQNIIEIFYIILIVIIKYNKQQIVITLIYNIIYINNIINY